MNLEKPQRQADPAYLVFIRSRPCLCKGKECRGIEVDPHHTITKGAGGSDYRAIPLCAGHHFIVHLKGLKYLEETYHFNHLDEIIKLLTEWLKKPLDETLN